MPTRNRITIGSIQRKVERTEGFVVRVFFNGKNANDNRGVSQDYKPMTVDAFKRHFKAQFPDFDIAVYANGSESSASGQTLLKTIRQSYETGKE